MKYWDLSCEKSGESKLNQEQEKSAFWTRWLFVVSIIVTLAGLCFAFVFPFLMPQVLEQFFIELTGTGFDSLTPGEIQFHNLLSGVIGGVMFGWGFLLILLSQRLIKNPENWIWSAVTVSVVGWYVVDILATILAGSILNLLLNTVIIILVLPALISKRSAIVRGFRD